MFWVRTLAGSLLLISVATCSHVSQPIATAKSDHGTSGWSPARAAAYLDKRAAWWTSWPPANQGNGTVCVSCHTVLPYLLVRRTLGTTLGESGPTEYESRLVNSVRQRVINWNSSQPFYADSSGPNKSVESRSSESVLNALILAARDAPAENLTSDTLAALNHMWALQVTRGEQSGSWAWLNFGNEPFEAADSRYYGAALAALAVGMAPERYRDRPDVRDHLRLLREYIRRECERQPSIHQVVALWASTKVPDLLTSEQTRRIIATVMNEQQSDGGWGLSTLGWTWRGQNAHSLINLWVRSNDSPWSRKSDGYATGLIVYVLHQAGVTRADTSLRQALQWLLSHQDKVEGFWPGYSLVNRRNPASGTGRFMVDAATAYAVLALTQGQ
jgi:squalene-hopene/tetraprenyl-beta-curcumene cyclase